MLKSAIWMLNKIKKQKGQSLIELLIAIAIFSFTISAVAFLIIDSYTANRLGLEITQATFLAEEGLEAAKAIRDNDWRNLTNGWHGLAISSNQWVFAGTQDKNDKYARSIEVAEEEANKLKKITSKIIWDFSSGDQQEISLIQYFSNWQAKWNNIFQSGSLDAQGQHDGLKLKTRDNYLYLIRDNDNPDFQIIDISNSDLPVEISTGMITLDGTPTDIAIEGNYAYVSSTSNNAELQIVNLSTNAVTSFDIPKSAYDAKGIFVRNSIVYLVTDYRFVIINAANSGSPQILGSLNLSSAASDIAMLGNYAYLSTASDSGELQAIDISSSANPQLRGTANPSGSSDAVSISGFNNIIILGRNNGDLYFYNTNSPISPSNVSFSLLNNFNIGPGYNINDLFVETSDLDKYLFIASNYQTVHKLQIYDISQTINSGISPAIISQYNYSDNIYGVYYDEFKNRVFAATANNSSEVIVLAPQY